MKLDEFAFVNQQLAGMLRAGIPLEGALRRTCETLHSGYLRSELTLLEEELARGVPLRQAVAARRLPDFYSRMLAVGARSHDLPALLTLLADYYQRLHLTWVRLKGLIFYPAIVLLVSFGVSVLIALIFGNFGGELRSTMAQAGVGRMTPESAWIYMAAGLWIPVMLLGGLTAACLLLLIVPRWRQWALWRLPGFREARLSNLASSLALLLQNGSSPGDAMALLNQLEGMSPAGRRGGGASRAAVVRLAGGGVRRELDRRVSPGGGSLL
jgi:type II secretory pathway component PulF